MTDGSDNATAWGNEIDKGSLTAGTFNSALSSLNATTQYFYRCRAINVQGADWADSTANFTTLAEGEELSAPTSFTATFVTENEVTLAWTPGSYAEYTMVRANYGTYPTTTEDGYCVYYGDGSNATDTIVDLNWRDDTICYSAFSENTSMSWSSDYATASVENLGMSALIDAILPLVILILVLVIAHWRRSVILLGISGFACMLYGWVYWDNGLYFSIIIVLMGGVCFIEAWVEGKSRKAARR